MSNGAQSGLPAAVLHMQREIERWRQRRRPRTRIPEELWRQAAELASANGIHPIAKALRLNYYALKRRVPAAADLGTRAPRFVEVLGVPTGAGGSLGIPDGQCLIELEEANGVKMRIRLDIGERADLLALVRVLREGR